VSVSDDHKGTMVLQTAVLVVKLFLIAVDAFACTPLETSTHVRTPLTGAALADVFAFLVSL
jgi:hypothetical protein